MATINLSQLPAPDVVESLDYESLLAKRKATLISLYPADQQHVIARTLTLESEPIVKLLQENAYRELILRQRINEAAQVVMVAYALDGDLDQLGANNGVTRLTITPADDTTIPPTTAVMESNDDFRLRIVSALEGLSVAGPTGLSVAELQDLRGDFVHDRDDGRGADSGHALLAAQGDAIRNITGVQSLYVAYNGKSEGTFYNNGKNANKGVYVEGILIQDGPLVGTASSGASTGEKVYINPSHVVPVAAENRPHNVAFYYIMRAA